VLIERSEQVPSLPSAAVFELEGQHYAYVLREGKARRIAIEVGMSGYATAGERTEIRGGLAPEDRVLSAAQGITEGMPVKVAGEEAAPEPAPPGEGQDQGGAKSRSGGKQGWGGGRKR
jgi:hypothetical protein